jgi:hypothetical protein
MKIEINLNDPIKVKLTELGVNILKEIKEYTKKKYNLSDDDFNYKVDDEGYYHTQLWCFMNEFGDHLGNGFENVIEHQ